MDGLYWDDWVFRDFVLRGDWEGNLTHYRVLGEPGIGILLWIVGSIGRAEFTYHWLSFILLIAIGLLCERIARTHVGMTRFESAVIGITAATYAAVETTFVFIVTIYLLELTCFLAATLCLLHLHATHGTKHIFLRVSAFLLFAISFQHNSLLPFFAGSVGLLLLQEYRHDRRTLWQLAIALLRKYPEFFLLPPVFWLINEWLFPRVEFYNKFNLSPDNFVSGFLSFISKGLMEQGREVLRHITTHLVPWAVAVIGGLGLWYPWRRHGEYLVSNRNRTWIILATGAVLFVVGALPYILVSKGPRAHGFGTRHALLVAIPVGIALAGMVRLLLRRRAWGGAVATVLLATAFAGSTLALWEGYARWQARWVKDRSIILYFQDHPELQAVGTFFMDDRLRFTLAEHYRFFDWSSMTTEAWGVQGYIGFSDPRGVGELPDWEATLQEMHWYNAKGYPHTPCHATMTIEAGTEPSSADYWALSHFYFQKKFLGTPEELDDFLRGVTTITVTPLEGCGATLRNA